MRVIGIDPGTVAAGFGVVESAGSSLRPVAYGVLRPARGLPYVERLLAMYRGIVEAIEQYRPSAVAVEEGFFGKSVRSAMKLGEGRAVALLGAAQSGLPVTTYAPAVVKKAVVGSGTADKSQVQEMVKCLLGLKEAAPEDASDALAVAICHCHRVGHEEMFKHAERRRR